MSGHDQASLSESCLIIVDAQNDFASPKGAFAQMGFDVTNLKAVIPAIKRFRQSLKDLGVPAIYVISHYDNIYVPNAMEERFRRVGYNLPFCFQGTWGAQIVDELRPEKDDMLVTKHRYDGFLGTDLDLVLRGMGIGELILTGIETHVCVQQTAISGYMLGYKIILIDDCSASIDTNDKEYALKYCRRYYGIVKSHKEILEETSGRL